MRWLLIVLSLLLAPVSLAQQISSDPFEAAFSACVKHLPSTKAVERALKSSGYKNVGSLQGGASTYFTLSGPIHVIVDEKSCFLAAHDWSRSKTKRHAKKLAQKYLGQISSIGESDLPNTSVLWASESGHIWVGVWRTKLDLGGASSFPVHIMSVD